MAIAYVGGCIAALLGGMRSPAAVLGLPLWFVSGWVFVGHLITIDDDFLGGWSNPGRSRNVLLRSLLELCVKGVVFVAISWVVLTFVG